MLAPALVDGRRRRPRAGRRLTAAAAAVTVLLALTACGGDDGDVASAAPSGSPTVGLERTTWELTAASALGPDLADVSVTARFADGTLAGSSGCNRYTTSYELDGSSLSIGADIAATRMACGPDETAVERAYLRRLPQVASFTIDGTTLTLAGPEGATLLQYRASGGAEALAGSWTVISYYARTAVTSVVGDVELTAEFGADGISGDGGCNGFSGPYVVAGEDISIGPLASTERSCGDPVLDQQETDYLAALQLATTYAVTGSRLDLFRPGGTYAATLERS